MQPRTHPRASSRLPICHRATARPRTGPPLAVNSVRFRFRGVAAHAAAAPSKGRSALDAVEITNVAVNFLREHVDQEVRIHYAITDGGSVPNVVPEQAEVWYFIRAPRRAQHLCARLHALSKLPYG